VEDVDGLTDELLSADRQVPFNFLEELQSGGIGVSDLTIAVGVGDGGGHVVEHGPLAGQGRALFELLLLSGIGGFELSDHLV